MKGWAGIIAIIFSILIIGCGGGGSDPLEPGSISADNGSTVIVNGSGNVNTGNGVINDGTDTNQNVLNACKFCCESCEQNPNDGITDDDCRQLCVSDLSCPETVPACMLVGEDGGGEEFPVPAPEPTPTPPLINQGFGGTGAL